MGAECLVVGVNLRPHECLGIVRVLIKGVVNHAWLRCLNGFVGDASQLQLLVNTTGFDVDSRQQHERCGFVEAGHWISGGAQVFHGFRLKNPWRCTLKGNPCMFQATNRWS